MTAALVLSLALIAAGDLPPVAYADGLGDAPPRAYAPVVPVRTASRVARVAAQVPAQAPAPQYIAPAPVYYTAPAPTPVYYYAAPGYATCVGGACGGPAGVRYVQPRRSGFSFFRRR